VVKAITEQMREGERGRDVWEGESNHEDSEAEKQKGERKQLVTLQSKFHATFSNHQLFFSATEESDGAVSKQLF